MDNLPPCAVTIAAVALGLVPGRAILFAGSIARVIYRGLRPRPEATAEPPTEPTREGGTSCGFAG
jgi:hypothetical protein